MPAIGPEWQPCVKLPITVHVREQRPGESHVSTREGITPVREDDLIMRGVQGEEYPIGREVFNSTYQLGEATQPAAAGWRALCQELIQAIDDDVIDTNDGPRFRAVVDRTRAALATPPAVDGDERLRLMTAGICSGYIAGHEATVEGHYGDPDEVAAEMAPMVLAEVGATPPAASDTTRVDALRTALREVIEACGGLATAEVSDEFLCLAPGEVRAQLAKAQRATPPAATREVWDEFVRELGELQHRAMGEGVRPRRDLVKWAQLLMAATREAGPVPQAGLTDEQLLELMPQQFRDDLATVSRLASYGTPVGPGLYRVSLNTGALAFARAVLARWGGAAVQPVPVSEPLPGANDTIHPTGECWWFEPHADGAWYLDTYQGNYTHWLPHWALPVPAADKGDVQP
jgi:hypothetical protein